MLFCWIIVEIIKDTIVILQMDRWIEPFQANESQNADIILHSVLKQTF